MVSRGVAVVVMWQSRHTTFRLTREEPGARWIAEEDLPSDEEDSSEEEEEEG